MGWVGLGWVGGKEMVKPGRAWGEACWAVDSAQRQRAGPSPVLHTAYTQECIMHVRCGRRWPA